MGGNKDGLSKKELIQCLQEAIILENNNSNINKEEIVQEVDELIKVLGSEKLDTISLSDFINIMTSE